MSCGAYNDCFCMLVPGMQALDEWITPLSEPFKWLLGQHEVRLLQRVAFLLSASPVAGYAVTHATILLAVCAGCAGVLPHVLQTLGVAGAFGIPNGSGCYAGHSGMDVFSGECGLLSWHALATPRHCSWMICQAFTLQC
jgi:hypothetical protein